MEHHTIIKSKYDKNQDVYKEQKEHQQTSDDQWHEEYATVLKLQCYFS